MSTTPQTGFDNDRLVHWLLDSLDLQTTVFHVGQYCGRWRASTAGRELASYHLVLRGDCWLHRPGEAPLRLQAGDGVFLLRDLPHFLSGDPLPPAAGTTAVMQPLSATADGSTGLACGFFHFRGALSALMMGSFPDCLVIRRDDPALAATHALFELMLAEAGGDPDHPSPLVARLTELLFFYVIREAARQDEVASGLWAISRRGEFAPLLDQLLREPGRDWSVEDMAQLAHMSRASFFKHFVEACGQPPAQFLLQLRMKIAAQRLNRGDTITRAAEHVGYQSYAAFSRAFKKVIGQQPGAYRRANAH
ncbi:AraC family transcriptional regulator [Uliginosibacterium sp. H1]|uniref:AraC family transcriptional regulator n=1 Tax=Uliginosibacterium sp. H1 TaxID=3114757 RepID=UPI002E18C638|nr:AraC family transcriptional regulator [Uliginosibacterium sp. H1]